MSFQIKDTITPDVRRKARALADTRPVLEAAGLQLVSITKRAFDDPSLRPTPWAPRKDSKPHPLLRLSGNLWQSITITNLTQRSVSVGSNAPYAAIQQLGSRKKKGRGSGIPPRPFFPVTVAGQLTPLAAQRVEATIRRKLDSLLHRGPGA